jgi:hypothetical protein
VALLALVTVELGGWSLLGLLTTRDALDPFEEQFFRAGHGHAGVLLVLSLMVVVLLERTPYAQPMQWTLGLGLLAGILLQSGGFFLHMLVGGESQGSAGTLVTRLGAIVIAAVLVAVAVGLLRGQRAPARSAVRGPDR